MRHDLFELGKDQYLRLPERLLIAASPENIEALQAADPEIVSSGATLCPLHNGDPLPVDVLAHAALVVIEVDPKHPASLRRLSQLRNQLPDAPIIAALADANVSLVRTLVRQGVSDVVSLPFKPDEVAASCANAMAEVRTRKHGSAALAPLFAVVRGVGGCGATTVATHLAGYLNSHAGTGRGVCMIDLDIQFGSLADYLGLAPRRTIHDLLDARDRLDADFLHSVAVQHSSGVHVIGAPPEIMPLEAVDAEQLLRVIELARREYDYVVLDMPANWTNWNLSVAISASIVLMVIELTIPSLRQARRRLELLRANGVDSDAVAIVANRVERRLFRSIGTSDVEKALGFPVAATIHAEADAVASAQDQGLLVEQVLRKSKFSNEVGELADQLMARVAARDAR